MLPAARETINLFAARFGRMPEIVVSAPGRVNLVGEHTDYNEGFVLPIAIDRRAFIAASISRHSSTSTLVAHDLGREVRINLASPLTPIARGDDRFFTNYLTGVVEQFRRRTDADIPNLDLLVCSTVPLGAGLSSSAAVEVAMATLLEAVTGISLDPIEKILLCQRAEHEFPGTPCGIMDMYTSVLAQRDHALLIDCRTNTSTHIPLPPAEDMTVIVVDTGVRHDLSAGEYAERRAACERVAGALGIRSLRDATVSMIDDARAKHAITEIEHRRAMHVVLENIRTLLAANALREGRLDEFCTQMFESHRSLRHLYEVSCPELDLIVDAAHDLRERTGDTLLGARMTGGGFGGCAIILCRAGAADSIETVIRARFQGAFGPNPELFRTTAAAGAVTVHV